MRIKILTTFLIWFISCTLTLSVLVQAKSTESIDFHASELSKVSEQYAGSAINWPIINKLALYDTSTNRFRLEASHIATLNRFKQSWLKLEQAKVSLQNARLGGAQVFASEEVLRVQSLLSQHRELVLTANVEEAIQLVDVIESEIIELAELTARRRIADIEAKLLNKSGKVDQRSGLLGTWFEATIGALFKRNDAVRTGKDSFAQILFIEGSDVLLSENTTAIIRTSRLDKLTNRSDIQIELTDGGLLTRLSQQVRDESDVTLIAGASTSFVHSSNFWLEADQNDRVNMSNYDGMVIVDAENEQVNLDENQGTFVIRGQRPAPAVQLLAAPEILKPKVQALIHAEQLELGWSEIKGAAFYEIETSASREFNSNVRAFRVMNTHHLLTTLAEGITYARVRAFDENGLRGLNSESITIVRLPGNVAPPIILDNHSGSIIYTFEKELILTGTTDPLARLTINNQPLPINSDGRFSSQVYVDSEKEILILAENTSGNARTLPVTVQWVNLERLADLTWSIPVSGNTIECGSKALITGVAYSFIEVVIETGTKKYRVPTGANGRWSREIDLSTCNPITISFFEKNSKSLLKELFFTAKN